MHHTYVDVYRAKCMTHRVPRQFCEGHLYHPLNWLNAGDKIVSYHQVSCLISLSEDIPVAVRKSLIVFLGILDYQKVEETRGTKLITV